MFHWTTVILGAGDDEVASGFDEVVKAVLDLAEYGTNLAESRRARPADDLTTNLVQAEVDGERLTSAEIGFVLHPAVRRGQRDHPQRDQSRHGGADPLSRRAGQMVE